MSRRVVLVTGAAGRIASAFAGACHGEYALRLLAMEGEVVAAPGEVVRGDITQPATLGPAMAGVDTVLHLAAEAHPHTPWDKCLRVNIDGTHHVMRAALEAGCRRVVFASSVHAVEAYPPGVVVREDDPPNPPDLYGVSKAAGEALGRYFSTRGLSVICVRIGAFHVPGGSLDRYTGRMRPLLLWAEDAVELLRRCVEVEGVSFAVVHATSANAQTRLDLTQTKRLLGYEPREGLR